MYQWSVEENRSVASLSDCNDHTAAAVMINLKEELLQLVHRGKETINIITYSPTSQYKNRKVFWLIEQFAIENTVTIRWIFLEVGHGKEIPDGVRAIVKAVIRNVISFSPDMPI